MPNYKLGRTFPETMEKLAARLCERRIAYAESGTLMTRDELQAIVLPDNLLDQMRMLHNDGVPQNRDTTVYIRLERAQIDGIDRNIHLRAHVHDAVFVRRMTYADAEISKQSGSGSMVLPDLSRLADGGAALLKWCHAVIKERRQKQLVMATVRAALKAMPTTGHILAGWPVLATLCTDGEWQARFRRPPVRMRAYAPDSTWMAEWKPYMRGAETLMLGAQMMVDLPNPPRDAVTMQVHAFEVLPPDRFKNDQDG